MKKLKYLLFILLVTLTVNVYAAGIKINPSTVDAGSATIELTGDVGKHSSVTFSLSDGNIGAITGVSPGSGFSFKQNNGTYEFSTSSNLSPGKIGTVNYNPKVTQTFSITPQNIKFDGTTPGEAAGGQITYNKPKNNDASLTSLTVSQGELKPAFNSGTTSYSVEVPDTINAIKILASAAEGATYSGSGVKNLELGKNEFQINVTAEDGKATKTYTITVLRGEEQKPSAFLKSLTINNIGCVLSPKFEKDNLKYTVDVGEDITDLEFKYETEETGAEVVVEGNTDLEDGENLVTITVEASDKSDKQVYEITVYKNMQSKSKKSKVVVHEKKKLKWWAILLIVLGILLLIGGVILILFKKGIIGKKKNKPKKEKKDNIKNVLFSDEEEEEVKEDTITEVKYDNEYLEEKTTTFNPNDLKEDTKELDMEKTKEYNFKDLE